MRFNKAGAEIFVPDGTEVNQALARTTVLAVSAHQDDIELMAVQGILECFGKADKWFTGVTTADGANSPKSDVYLNLTDKQMCEVRKNEQKKAASVGEYAAQIMLGYSSAEIKCKDNADITEDYVKILKAARPDTVYTHNLADKHDTHLGVVTKMIKAIRSLPKDLRPRKLIGCEVWRGLDWVNDDEKLVYDVSAHQNLTKALISVFDCQICVGTRYDLAAEGRRRANATYYESHNTDTAEMLAYAVDLTPLILDDSLSPREYICAYIERFENDVKSRLDKLI